ncbi:MAG TPA: IS200/IS605 family transposase [Saprospiraceae bacterium]|nr:IS200/IS605 family transposase [Saprospiraceae bacterium]HRG21684.1 IS200/IS605 family transposase [Saprospiraceae bacterium]
MASTYTKIYIHVICVVKSRANLIGQTWKEDLFKYMSGIITHKGHKSIIVNGVSDHVHILIGLKPAMSISDLVRDIKNNSTNYVNENRLCPTYFSWQEGYGAFSYGHSQLDHIYKYILNQEQHHPQKTLKAEYLEILKNNEVDYQEKYLFDWFED